MVTKEAEYPDRKKEKDPVDSIIDYFRNGAQPSILIDAMLGGSTPVVDDHLIIGDPGILTDLGQYILSP